MLRLPNRFIFCFLIVIFFVSGRAVGNTRESAIKSGFIYNFARYSQGDWFDARKNLSYTICSFDPQFTNIASHTLKGQTIKQLPVIVHLLTSEFENITDCNTLFISKNDHDKWMYLLTNKIFPKLMLVGDFDGFIASGGHINFFIVGGKVRFEVNTEKLDKTGIHMSSRVLRLGRTHKGGRS